MTYTVGKTETATVKQASTPITTAFVANGLITASGASFWLGGTKQGDRATISGCAIPANNGTWVITNVISDTQIMVANTFTAGLASGNVSTRVNQYNLTITDELNVNFFTIILGVIFTNPGVMNLIFTKNGIIQYSHCFDWIRFVHTGATTTHLNIQNHFVYSHDVSDTADWYFRCDSSDPGKTIVKIGTAGAEETHQIVPDVPGNIPESSYILLQAISGSGVTSDYYLWFNKGAGTDPEIEGRTPIEVSLVGDVTANDVRDSIIAAAEATWQFYARVSGANARIYNVYNGNVSDIQDGNSGLAVSTPIQGTGDNISVAGCAALFGIASDIGPGYFYGKLITQCYGSMMKGDENMVFGPNSAFSCSIINLNYAYLNYYSGSTDLFTNVIYSGDAWGPLIYQPIDLMDNFTVARSGAQAITGNTGTIEGLLKSTLSASPVWWIIGGAVVTVLNPKEPYTTGELFTLSTTNGNAGEIRYTWKPKFVYLNEVTKNFVPLEGVNIELFTIETTTKVETELTESPMITDANGQLINGSLNYIDLIDQVYGYQDGYYVNRFRYRCRASVAGFRQLEWIFEMKEKNEDIEIVLTKLGTDFEGEYST